MTIKLVENQKNNGRGVECFQVFVDDNFHYMDEDERYKAGEFATYEEALALAQSIVDEDLAHMKKPGMTADELHDLYTNFGDDPFILPSSKSDNFSAWNYAKAQSQKVCSG